MIETKLWLANLHYFTLMKSAMKQNKDNTKQGFELDRFLFDFKF